MFNLNSLVEGSYILRNSWLQVTFTVLCLRNSLAPNQSLSKRAMDILMLLAKNLISWHLLRRSRDWRLLCWRCNHGYIGKVHSRGP
jgi:hypothetical protein